MCASRWCAGYLQSFSPVPGLQVVAFTFIGLPAFEVNLFNDFNCKWNNVVRSINMLTDGKIQRGDFMYWLPIGQGPLEWNQLEQIKSDYLSARAFTKRPAQQTLENEMYFKLTQPREAPETGNGDDHYFFMRLLNAVINVCIRLSEIVAVGALEKIGFPEIIASSCKESSTRKSVLLVLLLLSRTIETWNLYIHLCSPRAVRSIQPWD